MQCNVDIFRFVNTKCLDSLQPGKIEYLDHLPENCRFMVSRAWKFFAHIKSGVTWVVFDSGWTNQQLMLSVWNSKFSQRRWIQHVYVSLCSFQWKWLVHVLRLQPISNAEIVWLRVEIRFMFRRDSVTILDHEYIYCYKMCMHSKWRSKQSSYFSNVYTINQPSYSRMDLAFDGKACIFFFARNNSHSS